MREKMFLEDLGLKESGLEKLVKASYHLLGLMSSLLPVKMRQEHGPSRLEPRHLRQLVRSTLISREDSLRLR